MSKSILTTLDEFLTLYTWRTKHNSLTREKNGIMWYDTQDIICEFPYDTPKALFSDLKRPISRWVTEIELYKLLMKWGEHAQMFWDSDYDWFDDDNENNVLTPHRPFPTMCFAQWVSHAVKGTSLYYIDCQEFLPEAEKVRLTEHLDNIHQKILSSLDNRTLTQLDDKYYEDGLTGNSIFTTTLPYIRKYGGYIDGMEHLSPGNRNRLAQHLQKITIKVHKRVLNIFQEMNDEEFYDYYLEYVQFSNKACQHTDSGELLRNRKDLK